MLCHSGLMVGNCAVFFHWSACKEGGLSMGSIAEWFTLVVALGALVAAVVAGTYAKRAADSAHTQARVAATALKIDARAREETQARLVYSRVKNYLHYPTGKTLVQGDGHEDRTAWDPDGVTRWLNGKDPAGRPSRGRLTTRETVLVTVEVQNRSAEIITDVYIYLVNPHLDGLGDREAKSVEVLAFAALFQTSAAEYSLSIPLPEGTVVDPRDPRPQELGSGWIPVVEFRDSSGVWWARRGPARIRKVVRSADELPGRDTVTKLYPEPENEIPS